MGFLGVYTAIYDYVPHGDSELAITEGDILYVLEKSGEDDWWKAKKKASGEDDDEPVGLIPNNYVEEAHPTHQARALYDYTRQTDEEISFREDAQLEVFDTSDPDWILVGLDGEYGFAPANYIELHEAGSEAPPPSLPRRPVQPEPEQEPESPQSPVHNPAAALAGIINQRKISTPAARLPPPQFTPEASDEDEPPMPKLPARPGSEVSTPAPPTIETYSPRSPSPGLAASPPYNRVSQNRGLDNEVSNYSPGGFHMYNISESVSVMGKRKKMPTTLGINIATGTIMIAPEKAGDGPEQTWTAEKMTHYSIEGKHVFLELVRPSKSIDFHAGAKDTAQEIVSALGELSGAVRAEGLREVIAAGAGSGRKKGQVLYDFMAQGDDEVTVAVGDEVIIVDDSKSEEWWQVKRLKNGKEGVVPSSYVEITGIISAPSTSGINVGKSFKEQNRLEEERLAKESLKAARREEDLRGSEVGPGMRLPERGSSLAASGNGASQQRHRESARNDNNQARSSKAKEPDASKVRTWTDRSKSFSVEAQFLALKDGKINLHKMNGVKIAVPVVKMSVEDLEYVERITGVSLDEDKPLSDIKKQRAAKESRPSGGVGATIEHPQKPEYDWFQFFLSCDVAVGLCERYTQTFQRDSMDESVLPDVDASVLRTLGIREGDIIKIMRFLDKKYGRTGKRSIGDESAEGESPGGLFSGPGGTLRNNTRKGRPAPAVQTNDVVDAKAFSQEDKETPKVHEGVPTPLASVPVPAKKDVVRSGFDDDAWEVKESKQPQAISQVPQSAATQVPQRPALTGAMQELSLLSAPLEPVKAQPTAPQPQQQLKSQPQQPQQPQGPPAVTPSFFTGIGNQQTGLPQQQPNQFASQQSIARQRPAPGQFQQNSLMPPLPPSRPLSAPQAASSFNPPPLQPQNTGIQNSSGYQQPSYGPQIAPPGQSLNEMQQRMQQNVTGMGMMPQPTGFQQFNTGVPNNFQQQQFPIQTGNTQFQNNAGPFTDPRSQQQFPLQQQPTGFQPSFSPPPQQFPQQAVNQQNMGQPNTNPSFPALQPTPTGITQQNLNQPNINSSFPALQPTPTGINGFNQTFNPPPVPPIPQQQIIAPLVPQKTGPPPPVRFGVNGDSKRLMSQATGRRANLQQATPQNPFGF
ncbi:hypothetical protein B7494_g7814 [Chlorociboria aeruginascens]|nr:hypothetical protein B7494_g7814 [Chlorociboria aeruginascens]